jgi:molybdate transport system regulatory protein
VVLGPTLRVLLGETTALGPGKARLLELIAETGSISRAAKELGMSYRRAWLLVDAMNRDFKAPLVETLRGGERGGGAALTALGREAASRYRAMEAKATGVLKDELNAFGKLLRVPPKPH